MCELDTLSAFILVISASRPGIDSLLGGVYENKGLLFVAKVKNGFVPRLRDEIFPTLKRLIAAQCLIHKSAREKDIAVGRVADGRENGATPLGHPEAGLPGGVR
jgi:hypothetical protein